MHGQIRWIAAGLMAAACGPLPPGTDTAGGTSTSSMTTTGDPPETTLTSTEPTTTATSDTSNTSGPPPECVKDSDCSGFCEYCSDGECYDAVGCCQVVPNPGGVDELRCQGYECYSDEDCEEGEACDDPPGWCTPKATIPVCERQPLVLSSIPLQGAPSAVALVDLDKDGALDVVAALPGEGLVEVRLGDGAGGFQPGATFASGLGPGGQRLAVADFNLDGSPDVAVILAAPVGELSLLFGQDAVLAAPVLSTHASEPTQIWAGDFDGDGLPDLLTHNAAPAGRVTLRLGDGMGGLGQELGLDALNNKAFVATVGAVADDPARLDLVATLEFGPGAELYQYQPGTGLLWIEGLSASGRAPHTGVAAGDLSGDGVDDVVGLRASSEVTLVQRWVMQAPLEELAIAGGMALGPVADVDGDAFADIVTTSQAGATLAVIFTSGAGAPCVQSHLLASAVSSELLTAGDVDGDGKADLLAGAAGEPSLTLLRSGP